MSRRALPLSRFGLVLWVVAVLLSAAYLPQVRAYLGDQPGGGWRLYLAASLVIVSIAAVVFAFARNRGRAGRTALRLGALVLVGAAGLALLANPDPRSRFIEAAHLIEYGILAMLALLATSGPPSAVVHLGRTLTVVGAVGLADESLQWVLPARAAEIRDVALNLFSGALGIGYGLIVWGPPWSKDVAAPLGGREAREGLLAAALLVLALGAFLDAVHRGFWIRWGHIEFRSMFRPIELDEMADERRARWAGLTESERETLLHPERRTWGIEDFYATEALRHIQARNDATERGETRSAAAENRLLERWYAPFVAATRSRVAFDDDRDAGFYRSPAMGHLWPWLTRFRLWVPVLAIVAVLGGLVYRAGGRG